MALTTYAANEIADHLNGVGSWTMPASLYLALYTATPTDAFVSGTPTGTEVTGGGYARMLITFGAASARAIGASSAESWTASGANYGTVVAIGILDAATVGNMIWFAPLGTSRTVNDGDTLEFASGAVDFAFSAS